MAGRRGAEIASGAPAGEQYDLFIGATGNLNRQKISVACRSQWKTPDFSAVALKNSLPADAAGARY
jgi:hypothetical protein